MGFRERGIYGDKAGVREDRCEWKLKGYVLHAGRGEARGD